MWTCRAEWPYGVGVCVWFGGWFGGWTRVKTNNRVLNNDKWKTPDVLGCFLLWFLFNYKDLLRGKVLGEFWRFRNFFFFFCIYLLGGSASSPLASRWYLWPPCRFSPKQSIKQIDPVHIVQHMGKAYCLTLCSLFSSSSFLFFIRTIAK